MARAFISYRRADRSELALLTSQKLKARLPEAAVFLDVENIEIGTDFSNAIFERIASCEIVILLIGASWIEAISHSESRENDWVKMEVETALRLKKTVIPIVTECESDFYNMPLPGSIRELRDLNCLEIHSLDDGAIDNLVSVTVKKLEASKDRNLEDLAKKIAKPVAAIRHVWEAIASAIDSGAGEPGPDNIWENVILLARKKHGPVKWKRILRNYRLEQSEDLGLIIFACIVNGFFIGSDDDNPSDYWGLGTIDDA
jgi:hypothetical protein